MPKHMARSGEGGCILIPCMVGETPILCMFGDHGEAGRGYLLACFLHPCWKAGVHEPALYWKIPCSLWQSLCGRLLTNTGDLGQKGVLRTLQRVVSLSAGKATCGRACLLLRTGWLEMFRAVLSSADGAERTLCVRDISTWARLCSLDPLDQVLTWFTPSTIHTADPGTVVCARQCSIVLNFFHFTC